MEFSKNILFKESGNPVIFLNRNALVADWPEAVKKEWNNTLIVMDEKVCDEDSFTIALETLSAKINSLPADPSAAKRKTPHQTNPEPRGSVGDAGKHTSRKKGYGNEQKPKDSPPANYKCIVCKLVAGHWPSQCSKRNAEQMNYSTEQWKNIAKQLKRDEAKTRSKNHKDAPLSYVRDAQILMARAQGSDDDFFSTVAFQSKECVVKTILDTGSDENVITTSALSLISYPLPAGMDNPSVEMVNGEMEQSQGIAQLDYIRLANRLVLRDITCIAIDNPEPFLLIGRPLMKSLGIDPQRDLNLLLGNITLDMPDDQIEDDEIISIPPTEETSSAIEALKVRTCIALTTAGVTDDIISEYLSLIEEFRRIFRVGLDASPPMRVDPYRPSMRPGKGPVRATPRRYNPRQSKFLRETVQKLTELGLLKRNQRSKWSSPVFLPPKRDSFRFTVDSRQVNSCIEPRAWPLPFMDIDLERAVASKYYAVLDADNGYFQIANDEEFAEVFSILTEDGIFTPTRLVQGTVDGVAVFQSAMMTILADKIHRTVAIWIDDIIVFQSSPQDLLSELRAVFQLFSKFGVKINPNKCTLFATEIQFCGKLISSKGIIPNNEFIQGLNTMSIPKTAGELQQFLAASNWIRNHIPNYSSLFKPLQDQLLKCTQQVGSSKATKLAKIPLQLTTDHINSFKECQEAIKNCTRLSYPKPDHILNLMTDASDLAWSIVLTQSPKDDMKKSIQDRNHEPLVFLSGNFTGSQLRWATVEKEAYPIIHALDKLDHYLKREDGFELFTDHRNLTYILNPDRDLNKINSDRLHRWASQLMSFRYVIHHISGEMNHWPDLLSRWGSPARSLRTFKLKIIPKPNQTFEWPTWEEIKTAQQNSESIPSDLKLDDESNLYKTDKGQVWISNESLANRILIIAHSGSSGHRGYDSTKKIICDRFWWSDYLSDIKYFVSKCLHCLRTYSGTVPRPFGEQIHGKHPNEVIHYDFCLVLGQYILIIRDDLSGFTRLRLCISADSSSVATHLLDWIADFGIPKIQVSDQGSHFKNRVITEINRKLRSHHHFTTAYSPFANGSIEIIVKDFLTTLKKLRFETNTPAKQWQSLLPMIQFALNHSPRKDKCNLSPVEIMTGIKPSNDLDAIFAPFNAKFSSKPLPLQDLKKHVEELAVSLSLMHKAVDEDVSNKREAHRRRRLKKSTKVNFGLGDFVLVSIPKQKIKNKLQIVWNGPYKIVEVINDNVFKVETLDGKKSEIVHAQRIRFYCESALLSEDFQTQEIDESEKFEISELLDIKTTTSGYSVLVRWLGFESVDDTWEPIHTLYEDIPLILHDFLISKNKENVWSDLNKM
jgi:hypothetical protein